MSYLTKNPILRREREGEGEREGERDYKKLKCFCNKIFLLYECFKQTNCFSEK